MWAFARTIGMTETEAWHLSPKKLYALQRQRMEDLETWSRILDSKVAVLLAGVLTPFVDPRKYPHGLSPRMFMPKYGEEEPDPEQTPQQQLELARTITRLMGGEIR